MEELLRLNTAMCSLNEEQFSLLVKHLGETYNFHLLDFFYVPFSSYNKYYVGLWLEQNKAVLSLIHKLVVFLSDNNEDALFELNQTQSKNDCNKITDNNVNKTMEELMANKLPLCLFNDNQIRFFVRLFGTKYLSKSLFGYFVNDVKTTNE